MAAARENSRNAARILIESGADANYYERGVSPLSQCLKYGHLAIAKLLIQSGADINKKHLEQEMGSQREATLLSRYVRADRIVIVEWLLSHGADPTIPEPFETVPARYALFKPRILQLLCEYGANPNSADMHNTLLNHCIWQVEDKAQLFLNIALLLAYGADINLCHSLLQYASLHAACKINNNTLVAYLLNRGAHKDIKNDEGKTPLELVKNNPDLYAMLASNTLPSMPAEAIQAENELQKLKQKIA